jgi:membrane-associated phospholipid phosphatase
MQSLMSQLRRILRDWRAVDIFCAVYVCVFSILVLAFYDRVESAGLVILANCLVIPLLGILRRMAIVAGSESYRFLLSAFPLIVFFWMYKQSGMMIQAATNGWLDYIIIEAEFAVVGVHPSLWFERLVSPWLTEIMMFAYFSYLPLLLIVSAILFFKREPETMDRFLTSLTIGYGVCFLLFVILPVQGPRHALADYYSLELEGPLFRHLTGLVEKYGHLTGGCFPSPHCTAGTVMLYALLKYHRKSFYVILPLVMLFFVSTVYGRYHYVTDILAGVLVATIAFMFEPHFERWWQTFRKNRVGV